MAIIINSPWIKGELAFQTRKAVQISVVAYEHAEGIPARFCSGLISAVDLSRMLKSEGIESILRIIDPTSIAYYCNGWEQKELQFRKIIANFLKESNVKFFFDEAEQVCDESLNFLNEIGADLDASTDEQVSELVQRIKLSGRRHGGESGAQNATLYMAAHPFSWLNMYCPLIWKKTYSNESFQFVNLMSKPEQRFSVIRKFLQKKRPELCTTNNPVDRYMTICNTPCYIPLEGEPMFIDLIKNGDNWCCDYYYNIRKRSSNHDRAYKDFKALMSFLKTENV